MIDLNDDAVCANYELIGRTGAKALEVGYLDDDPPHRWYAHAEYRGTRITVENCAGPAEAVEALAVRLVHGGRCQGCRRLVGAVDGPVPVGTIIGEATPADADVEKTRGVCRWTRQGRTWVRGCGNPAPDGSTRERLAQALAEAGAPTGMIAAARAGRWDDFLSDHPMPQHLAVEEFRANGLPDLAERVIAGDFDATAAESRAWVLSDEGRSTLAEFGRTPTTGGNRAERRKATRKARRQP